MRVFAYAAVLATGARVVQAQVGINCDGCRYPKYDDCDAVIKSFKFRNNNKIVSYNGKDGPEPSCTRWYCRVSQCWSMTNEDYGKRMEVDGGTLVGTYDNIKGFCEKFKAGGQSDSYISRWNDATHSAEEKLWGYTTIFNDPDQSPPSAKLRSLDGVATPNRFVGETVTLEQHEQWVNRAQQRPSTDGTGVHSRVSSVKSAIGAARRKDGDNGWCINHSAKTVRQESVFDARPRANNGVKTSYSITKSKSFTSTTSANIGGAFELFSAGVSFEYSETDSLSVTEGYEFTPRCKRNQQGRAFFYPFFDYYDVIFTPSGQRADVWLPVDAGHLFIKVCSRCSVSADLSFHLMSRP